MVKETDEQKNRRKEKKRQMQYLKTKIYPIPFVNSKGFRIGNYRILINKNNLPFSSTDQIDHYLLNLFNYVKRAPTEDVSTPEKRKKFNNEFFKYFTIHEDVNTPIPIKYVKQTADDNNISGGYYKKTKVRKSRGKKSIKNRTRKNRM